MVIFECTNVNHRLLSHNVVRCIVHLEPRPKLYYKGSLLSGIPRFHPRRGRDQLLSQHANQRHRQ
jgi:hypothetical protein